MLITDHIITALDGMAVQREETVDSPYYAHASQAGSCTRQVAYSILLAAGVIDPLPEAALNSRITWFIGDAIHDLVAAAVRSFDPDAVFEKAWSTDLVSGHADAVYHDPAGLIPPEWSGPLTPDGYAADLDGNPLNDRVVLEAKSMAVSYFYSAQAANGPRPEHLLQAAVSAMVLGADRVHIVYVCKNAPMSVYPLLEFVLPVPVMAATQALEALEYSARSARQGIIPIRALRGQEIPVPTDDWSCCHWCRYRDRCLLDGPGERVLPKKAQGASSNGNSNYLIPTSPNTLMPEIPSEELRRIGPGSLDATQLSDAAPRLAGELNAR